MDWELVLKSLQERGLRRRLRELEGPQGVLITLSGRPLVNFCSNDYLGLAADPRLVATAEEACARYGWGAGAAALISGHMTPHERLRATLRDFFASDSVLLFNSGYQANIGVIPALAGETGQIFSDELNHASLIDGCRLAKAPVSIYRHCDLDHLESLLKRSPAKEDKLIVTESLFSMEGDIAPLADMATLAARYDVLLYIDEAHAFGVCGPGGRGLWEEAMQRPIGAKRLGAKGAETGEAPVALPLEGATPAPMMTEAHACGVFGPGGQGLWAQCRSQNQMTFPEAQVVRIGTLGKAFGSYGAFVLASAALCDYLLNHARPFIFSTALPPAVVAASEQAVHIVMSEPERRERLWHNVQRLAKGLSREPVSPIIPYLIAGNEAVMAATERLLERGFYVQGIRAPTVPLGRERLRITVSAGHSDEQIDALISALHEAGSDAGGPEYEA